MGAEVFQVFAVQGGSQSVSTDVVLLTSSCFQCLQDKHKPALAKIFSIMHKSVSDFSQRMLNEMRRHNYVTPTNYLELVSGYKK